MKRVLDAAEIAIQPEIAHIGGVGKAKLVPGKCVRNWRACRVEERDDVVVVAEISDPYRDVAAEHLLRRRARLIDGEHVVIAHELLSETVELGEIAAEIHRRIRQCPQRYGRTLFIVGQSVQRSIADIQRIQVVPSQAR